MLGLKSSRSLYITVASSLLFLCALLIPSLSPTVTSSAETVTANITRTGYYVNLSSASAATGININLTPGSSAALSGTMDRLTVKTNAKNGYKVYAAVLNHNQLYHSGSPTSDPSKIINSISATPTSATPLTNNTWGYAIKHSVPQATANNFNDDYSATPLTPGQSFSPAASTKWAALPSANTGLAHLFSGIKNAHTGGDQLDIYYAAKVDSSLATGSYTATVRYTAVADNSTSPVGIVSPATITNPAVETPITITIPLYTSYTLESSQIAVQVDGKSCKNPTIITNNSTELKVSCTAPAKPEGGNARVVINVPVFAAPIEITGGINYQRPITGLNDLDTMQQMTPQICANTTTGTTKTLRDARDNKTYTVVKANDDNCWMTQNLALELATNKPLTRTDTDLPTSKPSWTPENTTQTTAGTPWNTTGGNYYDYERTHARSFRPPTTESGNSDGKYGILYNWYAATGGTTDNNFNAQWQESPGSICPKGWQLPNGKDASVNKSFAKLHSKYSSPSALTSAPLNFIKSGYYFNGGNYKSAGSGGWYWSGSVNIYTSAYGLYSSSGLVNPQYDNNRMLGYAVRCVAR